MEVTQPKVFSWHGRRILHSPSPAGFGESIVRMDSDDQDQQIRWENSEAISFPNWVFRCRRTAIPQERRTAFRSEAEQRSERSDADLMIVQEGFASSMLKKACIAGFIRWWIAFFTHGLSAHLDAMGVVLIFRGTPNGDRRAPLSANAYLVFRNCLRAIPQVLSLREKTAQCTDQEKVHSRFVLDFS